MKFYAVVVGKNPGIYEDWDQAKLQVNGFKGAIFKSFKTREEAKIWMNQGKENDNNQNEHKNLSSNSKSDDPQQAINSTGSGARNNSNNSNNNNNNVTNEPNLADCVPSFPPISPSTIRNDEKPTFKRKFNQIKQNNDSDCIGSNSDNNNSDNKNSNTIGSIISTINYYSPSLFYLFTDGGSRGNPGLSGCGGIIYDSSMRPVKEFYYYLGHQTNNVAEYSGLLLGLKHCILLNIKELEVQMDSNLCVSQVSKGWKVNKQHLKPFVEEAQSLIRNNFQSFNMKQIPRELNKVADKLSNDAMNAGQSGTGPIVDPFQFKVQ